MLLRLCSQHYFILVMNPVTFYNNKEKTCGMEEVLSERRRVYVCSQRKSK